MKSTVVIFILCVSGAYGFLFGDGDGPEWNSVKTTWGLNPLNHNYFAKQPLTVEKAKEAGFEQISSGCQGKFLGQRFVHGNDVSLILIYDNIGDIAGVQMGIPIAMATKYYNFTQQKMYNRDTVVGIDVYILTAYFVDPKTICQSNGNPNRKIGTTGSGLWLQNGTDPIRDSVSIPLSQSEVDKTNWVRGACFPSMGVHYWYENRLDMDCNSFVPAFLLYNKDKLTGFGWSSFGKYEFTERAEYPPLFTLGAFLVPVPKCMPQVFNEAGGVTTMHIYFNAEPWNVLC